LAFLRADLVEHWQWLSSGQLLDATAVGQFTPGPVFTTATFIGFILKGPMGALVATLGIFLPAFIFVGMTAPFTQSLLKSGTARLFLNGVNAASLALMACVCLQLSEDAINTLPALIEFLCGGLIVMRLKLNPTWLILGGALLGYIGAPLHWFG
jgi:chromate transporter